MRAEDRRLLAKEMGVFSNTGALTERIDDSERVVIINKIIIVAALAFFGG